jgi:arylsulfatase A-like enzyme
MTNLHLSLSNACRYMNQGGHQRWNRSSPIGSTPAQPFPADAHVELQQGYAAAVSFVDAQVGRLLAVVTELGLWEHLTVVLTSDHGMHNGICCDVLCRAVPCCAVTCCAMMCCAVMVYFLLWGSER